MIAAGIVGLMERELEMAHIQRAVDHSWHGVGRLVVIEGPAGIGKTTLLAAAREVARDGGMNARAARAAELEQGFAFGVVRQLLDPLLAAASEAQRAQWLSGAAELAAPLFDPRAAIIDRAGHATGVLQQLGERERSLAQRRVARRGQARQQLECGRRC